MSNQGTTKYKTTMCKHYNTQKGCVYNDKCQFAHGEQELKPSSFGMNYSGNSGMSNGMNNKYQKNDDGMNQKKTPNPSNFKIVKCKNFEKDGMCKYGSTCTFAHGDTELRTKVENSMLGQGNTSNNNMVNPYMYQPYMMDPNFMMYMNQMSQMNPMMGVDMSQMQMYGQDPNNLNLNSTTTSNGNGVNFSDFQNPNMNFYQAYPQTNVQGNFNGQNPNN